MSWQWTLTLATVAVINKDLFIIVFSNEFFLRVLRFHWLWFQLDSWFLTFTLRIDEIILYNVKVVVHSDEPTEMISWLVWIPALLWSFLPSFWLLFWFYSLQLYCFGSFLRRCLWQPQAAVFSQKALRKQLYTAFQQTGKDTN